ncbi:MAG: DUF2135 domain-containing protein [Planctomycetota bacterium]
MPDFPGPRIRIDRNPPLPIWGSRVNMARGGDDAGFLQKSVPASTPAPVVASASATIERLKHAPRGSLDGIYFAARTKDPAFFVAAAEIYLAKGLRHRALRVLTNLAELDPGDPALLRVLAYRLEEANAPLLALPLLEKIAELRPEEPQSLRDLALVQASLANVTSAAVNLARVAGGTWDSRFAGIQQIAARELLRLVDPRSVEVDLRVVLTWDANDCDVDLWVTEPSGNRVWYSASRSPSGAWFSRDFTQGYGPEEIVVPVAADGEYVVHANFFGDRRQTRATGVSIRATIVGNYGRPDEERKVSVRRMEGQKEVIELARVNIALRGAVSSR